MTIAGEIQYSADKTQFTLYKEGIFYKCYNEDAMVFVANIREYKVSSKFIKSVGATVFSIGFPVSEVEKGSLSLEYISEKFGASGIYEQDIKSSDVIGQEMWDKSIRMAEKHSSEIKYTDFGNPVVISNIALLADLNLSFDLINIYTWFSIIILEDIKVLISDIEAELSTL